ncbi:MAG: condensation domain-containing protein [Actinomycetota bacterium]|nr:condensation domain-containing protein [Actinomycetota bacterium]
MSTTEQAPAGAQAAAPPPGSAAPVRRAPLSLTQRSSLLMAPHSPSREFMSWVYQLNGRLDVEALVAAVDDVVCAHDLLRVRFEPGAGGDVESARQYVTEFRPGVVRIVELDDRPKLEALSAAIVAVEAEYRDLSPWDEPRLGATLYVVAPKTHVLSIFVAEALVDGESGTMVAAELSRAYARHAGKTPPDLPCPSEGSYLRWVLDNPVPAAVQQRAVDHWRALRDEPVAAGSWPMTLPCGVRPRTRFFNVPAGHWRHLVDVTPGMAAMPFVVVLSWLELALARVAGARRFVVTSAVSNRSRPGAKDILGNFVGPVRMVAEVAPSDRLEDVSPRVLRSLREAIAASVVPVPLAEARLQAPAPFTPPEPTVSFFMFDEREGPDFVGVRQRRFRVHTGRDVLRVNCTPDESGGRNFFVISGSAPAALMDDLVAELQRHLGLPGPG